MDNYRYANFWFVVKGNCYNSRKKHVACHLIHAGSPQVYFIHHIINIGLANMAVSLAGSAVCVWNPGRSVGSPAVVSGRC